MKKTIGKSLFFLLAAAILISTSAVLCSAYIHDPMDNPKAAADIIVDPDAVYGYSPNPDSTRLGTYAQYDWSDEAVVADMRNQI